MITRLARAGVMALALLMCGVLAMPSGWNGGEAHAATQKQKPKKAKTKKERPAKPAKAAPKLPEKPKERWQLPMKVVIVRGSDPACEPDCPEWIMAEGEITPGTPAAFRKVLKQLGKRKLPVVLHSPGGRIDAAMEVGRLLRKNKLATSVGRTEYRGCGPYDPSCKLPKQQKGVYSGSIVSSGSYCASACPLILAGGTERLANAESRIGVHQIRTESSRELVRYQETYRMVNGKKKVISRKVVSRKVVQGKTTYGINKSMWKRLAAYAREMGVSPELVDDMNSARHDSLYFLTIDRRKKLALVTRNESAASLSNRYACKNGSSAGPVCVTREDFAPKPAEQVASATAPPDYMTALQRVGVDTDAPSMIFAVVRNSGSGCEPQCPQWISAMGTITSASPADFAALLDRLGNIKLPVILESTGGDLGAALEIGRMIRARGLETVIAGVQFIRCAPGDPSCPTKAESSYYKGFPYFTGKCHGACLFAALGGVRVTSGKVNGPNISGSGVYRLHRPSRYVSRAGKTSSEVLLETYVDDMSISKKLLQRIERLTPYEAWLPSPEEETKLLGMQHQHPTMLLSPRDCKTEVPPVHCVKLAPAS